MSESATPQWKSWYRWPCLLLSLAGGAMVVIGIRDCITLVGALRTLPPTIVVETSMSALPTLGIGVMATGLLGWLPRKADGSGLRPIRTRRGGERDPGAIVVVIMLVSLLLYPVARITLRVVTANMLLARGYMEKTERVRPASSYVTTRWTR